MEQKKDVMERVKMLPENFDGIVRFTNWSDEDFTGRWNSKDYLFPANTTSPLFIPEHSPLETLNIVKKFALNLAEREWGKSQWMKDSLKRNQDQYGNPIKMSMQSAPSYSVDQLAPLIQKGLYLYEPARAQVSDAERMKTEDKLHLDDEGKQVTKAIKKGASMQDLERSFNE